MNQILTKGQAVRTSLSGRTCVVELLLGAGGQGEVYRANLDGRPVALKWYFPSTATPDQWGSLETLVKKGAPDRRFLWPEELATSPGTHGFGYIMPLREARHQSIIALMKGRASPTFRSLATAGYQLADSYFQLHAKGFCYRDISFGNVFFDPSSGDVLICDNDNVGIDGESEGGVLGTPRFMAPEVVCGKALPSSNTDRYSLAVLLFYMFAMHHPLEGRLESAIRCLDLPAMTKLYGTDALFIYHPENQANRPVPGYHDNAITYWENVLPTFLKDLFVRAFTDGLADPNGRVRETEWRAAMVRLRDSIIYCPHCSSDARDPTECFYDVDALRASGGSPGKCWNCGREVPLPPRIRLGTKIVTLNFDTKLYAHHVDDARMWDFTTPVADVVQHPSRPGVWGLRNLSQQNWATTGADGVTTDVAPGRSVTVARGTTIQFGSVVGTIQA
jgi:DNA-binding helix-hairpin-helix protein with protein kinase domain